MNLDDLLRLAGATGGTNADVAPRGIPAPFGPPPPAPPLTLAPAVAQPPNIPVPSAGDAVMGPAGPLERLAGRLPGNSIAGLLDLAGSLVRGHSAYADAARRASLNSFADELAAQHTESRQKALKAASELSASRADNLLKSDLRLNQMQAAMTRHQEIMKAAEEHLMTAENEVDKATAKNLYDTHAQALDKLQRDFTRRYSEVKRSASMTPEDMAYLNSLGINSSSIASGAQGFGAPAQPAVAETPDEATPPLALPPGIPRPPKAETSATAAGDYSNEIHTSPHGAKWIDIAAIPVAMRKTDVPQLQKQGIRVLPSDQAKAATAVQQAHDALLTMARQAAILPNDVGFTSTIADPFQSLTGLGAGGDLKTLRQTTEPLLGVSKAIGGTTIRTSQQLMDRMQRIQGLGQTDTKKIASPRIKQGGGYLRDAERAIFGDSVPTDDPAFDAAVDEAMGFKPRPNPSARMAGSRAAKKRPPLSSFVK